jgi:hypothetical protein
MTGLLGRHFYGIRVGAFARQGVGLGYLRIIECGV